MPDGLTVDAEGFVWLAVWDGWMVIRYEPDGRVVQRLALPGPRPTSCCFGGADLRTLYITTASVRLPARCIRAAGDRVRGLSSAAFKAPRRSSRGSRTGLRGVAGNRTGGCQPDHDAWY